MRILRIGDGTVSYTRYLDLLEHPDVERLIILVDERSAFGAKVLEACSHARDPEACRAKLIVETYRSPFFFKVAWRLLADERVRRILAKAGVWSEAPFALLLRLARWPELTRALREHEPSIIWTGSNDFDGSNLLTWWAHVQAPDAPIVRSYKEHRCRHLADERNALLASEIAIVPSHRNRSHLTRQYWGLAQKGVRIADEDWRYSGLVEHTAANRPSKLSAEDGIPHVVILTGRATYVDDWRGGSRYNYLDIIRRLVARGVHVHMHVVSIQRSVSDTTSPPDNPYASLAEESPLFTIHAPLDLEGDWSQYAILGRYDAGILHNYVPGEAVAQFTQMNVPNRLFEYLVAGVAPLLIRGTMLDAQDTLEGLGVGVIGDDYDDLCDLLLSSYDDLDPLAAHDMPTFADYAAKLIEIGRFCDRR